MPEEKTEKPIEVEVKPQETEEKEEVKEEIIKPSEVPVRRTEQEAILDDWKPKTELGKKVFEGKITSIDEILESGVRISEPEIVDRLVPGLKNELILIGGRTGKGGGIQRIPVKITAAMHKSGRRFNYSAFIVVGNEDGLIGVAKGTAVEPRDAFAKGTQKAKMNIIRVKRGCGSWECECGEEHSVRFRTEGRSGSVRIILEPAPKGVGLVASTEVKKILRLAGIKDVWVKSFGKTGTRMNVINAVFDALKHLYVYDR